MKTSLLIGSIIAAGLLFSGCGDDNASDSTSSSSSSSSSVSSMVSSSSSSSSLSSASSSSSSAVPMAEYEVTVTNLTHAQPMSPLAAVLHVHATPRFIVGGKASAGLEKLAEGGDNALWLSEAAGAVSTRSGSDPIAPGGSDSVTLEGNGAECISLAAMLVNTNDGFVGANCIDISRLQAGDAISVAGLSYDAGTESNTENAATIPGPAGGGEGYNAVRDDRDFIALHSGVVTADDGLTGSALTGKHRWDNPVAHITIKRIK